MKCYIKGYDKVKYEADSTERFQYDLEGVANFKVVQGEGNIGIQLEGWERKDDYHEYLIIFFEDGSQTVYFNSYVDLFKY